MKRIKITSILLSAAMCMSVIATPVSVLADDIATPSESQSIEASEPNETEVAKDNVKETENKEKETEPPKTNESKPSKEDDKITAETTDSEPTKETEICETSGKESPASESKTTETSAIPEENNTDKTDAVSTDNTAPGKAVKRNAKNITVSEIQSKLNTKMTQSGYVPGGKPPTSYTNGASCYGFVDSLCRYLFNHGLPSQASSKYALVSSNNFSQVGSTLTYSAGNVSASSLKSLFMSAQPGDVVQMNYYSDKAADGSADYHTLMVYSVSDSGVVFYHAGSSTVYYGGLWKTNGSVFSWSSFASWFGESGDGISVYRSKQSNGTPLPSNTWIKSSAGSSITTGTNVTLTWGASNAASYWLHIYKDGSDYYNAGQNGNTSWSHTFTQIGTYTCYITPYGQSGYISSSEGPNANVTITVTSLSAPQISNFRIVDSIRDSEDERFTFIDFEATIINPGSGITRYDVYDYTNSRVDYSIGYFQQYYYKAEIDGNRITCRFKINTGKSITFILYASTTTDANFKYNLASVDYKAPEKIMPTISNYRITAMGDDYIDLAATIVDFGNTGNNTPSKYFCIGCTPGTTWNRKTSEGPTCVYTKGQLTGNEFVCRVPITSEQQYCLSFICSYDWAGSFAKYNCGDIVINFVVAPKNGETITIDNNRYVVTDQNTDGTGTVKLTGVVNQTESISIPDKVIYKGITYKVTSIDPKAFAGDTTLKYLYIGPNILTIGNYAFYGCSNLIKVSGGAGLKTIGTYAFAKCPKLSSFNLSSKVLAKVGAYVFSGDKKLKTLYIKYTTKLTKSGVKKSLKGSKVKTVKVKKSKVKKYKKYFTKKNCGRKVKVKK